MNINKYKLPFVATALVMILTGCGGESANVTPEVYDESTANGACKAGKLSLLSFSLGLSCFEGCVVTHLNFAFSGLFEKILLQ